ncbi:hypothetical protein N0V94_006947 [Neodidymelliopsis sp. IMI 364377]|nr:hypothetical protein N0V94_006947 [Neodidymelliopsis sp. IMI 364377]
MPTAQSKLLFLGVVVTVLSLYWGYTSQCPTNAQQAHTGYLEYECAGKPHHSSWSSWWHPQRGDSVLTERRQGAGATIKDWNILYHLGGNGPWVEKVVDVVESGIAVPEGYQRAVFEKMKQSGMKFTGSLAFFNDWELFWSGQSRLDTYSPSSLRSSTDDKQLEQLTSTGPFSGRLGSFTTGVRLRTRYHHLVDQALARNATTYWASGSQRVIETARHFALGLFGLDADATLEVISEDKTRGANTLTPGRTCTANLIDTQEGKMKGYRLMGEYRATYLPAIAARLSLETRLNFTTQDIFSMQEMCGFETTVRGKSHWCDIFTRQEFLAFEYARDLLHYYRAGPGQKYAAAMGWLWLDATTKLLLEGGEKAGPLFFSFVHDGDIAPMLTALDIITDMHHLPPTHIPSSRKWRKSQVSPMGGRVIFELLACNPLQAENTKRKFVRVNINDGITALHDCRSGPGESCPLGEFRERGLRFYTSEDRTLVVG